MYIIIVNKLVILFFSLSPVILLDSYSSCQRAKRETKRKNMKRYGGSIFFLTRIFHFPLKNNAVNRRRK